MQGKSLVIYSKFNNSQFFEILELEMTDFWNFWSISWELSETRYAHGIQSIYVNSWFIGIFTNKIFEGRLRRTDKNLD